MFSDCLGKCCTHIAIETCRYLLSKCNYGDVFKVHKHKYREKKKLFVRVFCDVDWKLNSRHKNWVCPFSKTNKYKKCERILILIINLTQ